MWLMEDRQRLADLLLAIRQLQDEWQTVRAALTAAEGQLARRWDDQLALTQRVQRLETNRIRATQGLRSIRTDSWPLAPSSSVASPSAPPSPSSAMGSGGGGEPIRPVHTCRTEEEGGEATCPACLMAITEG